MADTQRGEGVIVASLRRHVLIPIETAETAVETEYEEVKAERHAYEKFKGQVGRIETVTASATPATPVTRTCVDSTPDAVEQLRSSFRATVRSVDHYEEVDESMEEHVASELSPDIAALFQDSCGKSFTEHKKTMLVTAVQQAIDDRDNFLEMLDREQESLTSSRRALLAILDEQDGARVPDHYRTEFESKLDVIAEDRQQTLNSRPSTVRTNGHDLCVYLYRKRDWTYPVLTALARFRRTVI